MIVKEGLIHKQEINPLVARRFCIHNIHLGNHKLRRRLQPFIVIYKIFALVVFPVLVVLFYVLIFSTINKYETYWITYVILLLLFAYCIINTIKFAPRSYLMSKGMVHVIKSANKSPNKSKVSLYSFFFWLGIVKTYVASLTFKNVLGNFRLDSDTFGNFLDSILGLSIGLFFLINPSLQLSHNIFIDFVFLAFTGTLDILTSGLISSSLGLYIPIYVTSKMELCLISTMNISLLSGIILSGYRQIKTVLDGTQLIEGNYSLLSAFANAFDIEIINSSIIIYDYGPVAFPSTSPCVWYMDDIKKLSLKEIDWTLKKITNNENMWDESDLSQLHFLNHIRLFRRIQESIFSKEDTDSYCLDIESIFAYRGKIFLNMEPKAIFDSYSKLIINTEKNEINIVDNKNILHKLPFKIVPSLFTPAFPSGENGTCVVGVPVTNGRKYVNYQTINFVVN